MSIKYSVWVKPSNGPLPLIFQADDKSANSGQKFEKDAAIELAKYKKLLNPHKDFIVIKEESYKNFYIVFDTSN